MRSNFFVLACVLLGSANLYAAPFGSDPCGRGWVFFDLGNTLVDTSDSSHVKYMPGAHDYLRQLHAAGFHIGMISNVPDSWGPTVETKLAYMKEYLGKSWSSPDAFAWEDFETILLPPSDSQRKPAPFLFLQARELELHCQIAYLSEDPAEVRAALSAGFDQGFVVSTTNADGFYPAPDRIFQSRLPNKIRP